MHDERDNHIDETEWATARNLQTIYSFPSALILSYLVDRPRTKKRREQEKSNKSRRRSIDACRKPHIFHHENEAEPVDKTVKACLMISTVLVAVVRRVVPFFFSLSFRHQNVRANTAVRAFLSQSHHVEYAYQTMNERQQALECKTMNDNLLFV